MKKNCFAITAFFTVIVFLAGCSRGSNISDTIRSRKEDSVITQTQTSEEGGMDLDSILDFFSEDSDIPWSVTDTSQMLYTETGYDSSGSLSSRSVYGYDSYGRQNLILTIPSDPDSYTGYILQYTAYEGDKKTSYFYPGYSLVVAENKAVFPGIVTESRSYDIEYSSYSNLDQAACEATLNTETLWDFDEDSRTAVSDIGSAVYDDNGNIIEQTLVLGDDSTVYYKYTYDDQDRLTEMLAQSEDSSTDTYSIYTYERSGDEEICTHTDGYTGKKNGESRRAYYSLGGSWEDVARLYGDFPGTWVSDDGKHILVLAIGEIFMRGYVDDATDTVMILEYGFYTIDSENRASTDTVFTHTGWVSGEPEIDETKDIRLDGDALYYGDERYTCQ